MSSKNKSSFEKRIEERLGKQVLFQPAKAPSHPQFRIMTDSLSINRCLAGGVYGGRMSMFFGPSSVYKSTVVYDLISNAQKLRDKGKIKRKKIALIDTEKSYTVQYLKKRGVDVDDKDFYVVDNVSDANEMADVVFELLESKEFCLICIDSLTAMTTVKEMELETARDVQKLVGVFSRFVSFFFKKMTNMLDGGTAVVFTNQIRTDVQSMMTRAIKGEKGDSPTGGHGAKFYPSTAIEFTHQKAEGTEKLENIPAPIPVKRNKFESWLISCRVEKTRASGHDGLEIVFRFNPKTSKIDEVQEIVTLGREDGHIKVKGAWYYYIDSDGEEQKLGHGISNVRIKLLKDKKLKKYLRSKIEETTLKEYTT